jgi:hypothetical protein
MIVIFFFEEATNGFSKGFSFIAHQQTMFLYQDKLPCRFLSLNYREPKNSKLAPPARKALVSFTF